MRDAYRDDHEAALQQIAALQRENTELRARVESLDAQRMRAHSWLGREIHGTGAFLTGTLFFVGLVAAATAASRVLQVPTPPTQGEAYAACLGLSHPSGPDETAGLLRVSIKPAAEAVVSVDGVPMPVESGAPAVLPVEPEREHCVHVRATGFRPADECVWVRAGDTRAIDVVLTRASLPTAH